MPPTSRSWQSPVAPDRPRITALSQALALAQAPRLVSRMRGQPLPREVVTVIRLAAGCRETLAGAAAATARSPDFLVTAAELYLRQVVCHPGADPYRVLGVSAQASRAEMRGHMRELVLWLHPDRNPRGGDRALMERVLKAWQDVSGPGPVAAPSAMPERQGRIPAFRPSWIAQPVPKARSRFALWVRLRLILPFTLRCALVAASLLVPGLCALAPPGLREALTRLQEGPRAGVATHRVAQASSTGALGRSRAG